MEEQLEETKAQAIRDKEALEAAIREQQEREQEKLQEAINAMHVKEEAENDVEESGGELVRKTGMKLSDF